MMKNCNRSNVTIYVIYVTVNKYTVINIQYTVKCTEFESKNVIVILFTVKDHKRIFPQFPVTFYI